MVTTAITPGICGVKAVLGLPDPSTTLGCSLLLVGALHPFLGPELLQCPNPPHIPFSAAGTATGIGATGAGGDEGTPLGGAGPDLHSSRWALQEGGLF